MTDSKSVGYMVIQEGTEYGPLTIAELAARLVAGGIDAETLIMPKKLFTTGWAPLKEHLPQLLSPEQKAAEAESQAAGLRQRKNEMSFGDVVLCVLLPIPALFIGLFRLADEDQGRRGAKMTLTSLIFTIIGIALIYARVKYGS